jgi:hypothetical protein
LKDFFPDFFYNKVEKGRIFKADGISHIVSITLRMWPIPIGQCMNELDTIGWLAR